MPQKKHDTSDQPDHQAPAPRHLLVGQRGEEIAAQHLAAKGLVIVERRAWYRRGEIDIVARDGQTWVFVEVKTRSSVRYGIPEASMTPWKLKRMERAVKEYIWKHNLSAALIRCDFVGVLLHKDKDPEIRHYPGAFFT